MELLVLLVIGVVIGVIWTWLWYGVMGTGSHEYDLDVWYGVLLEGIAGMAFPCDILVCWDW